MIGPQAQMNKTQIVGAYQSPNAMVAQAEVSSDEKIEQKRLRGSKRQFNIRKNNGRSNSKSKLRSPSDITHGGRSVVSFFTNHSASSGHSAPLLSQSLTESPHKLQQKQKDLKRQRKQAKAAESSGKELAQTMSKQAFKKKNSQSYSPRNNDLANSSVGFQKAASIQVKDMHLANTTFSVGASSVKSIKERPGSAKKMIPLKTIKFPVKKKPTNAAQTFAVLDKKQGGQKPPKPFKADAPGTIAQQSFGNTEDVLKMADEGLKTIERELKQTKGKSVPKFNLKNTEYLQKSISMTAGMENYPKVDNRSNSTLSSKAPKKNEIQANFNLSVHNSFNTSYNNGKDQDCQDISSQQILAFSSSPHVGKGEEPRVPTFQGFFTQDAVNIEQQFTNRMLEASNDEDAKMAAVNQTFSEVIQKDKHFGSLLMKIKQAYDDYLRRAIESQMASPVAQDKPSYEHLQQKLLEAQVQLEAEHKDKAKLQAQVDEQQHSILDLKNQCQEKTLIMDQLQIELDRQCGNYESFKMSQVINASVSDTMKSLQFSNSSNRTVPHLQGTPQPMTNKHSSGQDKLIQQNPHSRHSFSVNTQRKLMKDLNFLMSQNVDLTNAMNQMQEDLNYGKEREKKIMYLVYTLQTRGFPVDEVFEKEIKPIPTLRFQEFLDTQQKEKELQVESEEIKAMFSFRTDDSYEPFPYADIPLRRKPSCIPSLDFKDFPVYETSSDEDNDIDLDQAAQAEQLEATQNDYSDQLAYISNFYSKYAHQQQMNSSEEDFSRATGPIESFDAGQDDGQISGDKGQQ